MDPDFNEIELSTEEAVRQIQSLSRAFYSHISDLQDVIATTVKFNAEGEIAQYAVKALTKDLQTLSVAVTDVDGQFLKTSVSVGESTSKYRELARAAQESAAALRAVIEGAAGNRQAETVAATADALRSAMASALRGASAGMASPEELRKFERAMDQLATTAAKAGVSMSELQSVYARMAAGSDDFTIKERQLVYMLQDAERAARGFGRAYADESERARAAAQRRVDQADAAAERVARDAEREAASVRKVTEELRRRNEAEAAYALMNSRWGGGASKASPAEQAGWEAAVGRVVEMARTGQVTVKQLEDVLNRMGTAGGAVPASMQKVAAALGQVMAAAGKFGNEGTAAVQRFEAEQERAAAQAEANSARMVAAAEAERQKIIQVTDALALQNARRGDAEAARAFAQGLASPGNAGRAVAAEVAAYDAAVNKLTADIASGRMAWGDVQSAFAKMSAGATDFTLQEDRAALAILKIQMAAANLGQTNDRLVAQNAASSEQRMTQIDRETAATARQSDEMIRQAAQVAEALTRRNAAMQARGQMEGLFGGRKITLGASIEEAQAYDRALNRIVEDVRGGTTSLATFQSAIAKITSGASDFTISEARVAGQLETLRQASARVGEDGKAAFQKWQAEQDKIAAQADRNTEKLLAEAAAIQRAIAAAGALYDREAAARQQREAAVRAFGTQLAGANPSQLSAFNAALSRALDLLKEGKVSASQFGYALNQAAGGQRLRTDLPPALDELQGRLYRVRRSLEETGSASDKMGINFVLSWQNVLRMFQSQVLFRAFATLQNEMARSVEAAEEFSKKVALIQTISQDADLSALQWARGLRAVSDELGSPIVDTAAAAYDLLSNQVTRGADTFDVLREALVFGRTTNASATDSVNLLSSAVNSFRLGSDQAAHVARTFFTTIDLGRVTASEMANSFGRSGALAETLGLRLEELQAGISSMTRQGIKAHEAYTLINNVFLKLIKPTKELHEWFKKMGYENGQDAVQAMGFVGVLKALDREFDGSTTKVAKFFDELRGARGALNLTGQGLQEFLKDLEQITNSGDKYDVAKTLMAQSPGVKLQVEFNKFKNYMINDFGTAVVETAVRVIDAVGGLERAVKAVMGPVTVLGTMAAGAIAALLLRQALFAAWAAAAAAIGAIANAWRATTWAAAAYQLVASAGMASWTVAIAAAGAAVAGLALAFSRASGITHDAMVQNIAEAAEGLRAAGEARRAELDRESQDLQNALERQKHAVLQFAAEVKSRYGDAVEAVRAQNKELVASVANAFDVMRNIVSKALTDIEGKAKQALENVKKAQEAAADVTRDETRGRYDRDIDRAKGMKDYRAEVRLTTEYIKDLRRQAQDAFDRRNVEDMKKAYEDIAKAVAGMEGAKRALGNWGPGKVVEPGKEGTPHDVEGGVEVIRGSRPPLRDRAAVQTEREIADLRREELELFKQLEEAEKERARNLEKAALEQRKAFEDMKTAMDEVKKFSLYDSKGVLKKEYEGAEGGARALADLARLQKSVTDAAERAGVGLTDNLAVRTAFFEQWVKVQAEMQAMMRSVTGQTNLARQAEDAAKASGDLRKNMEGAALAAERYRTAMKEAESEVERQFGNIYGLIKSIQDANAAGWTSLGGYGGLKDDLDRLLKAMVDFKNEVPGAEQRARELIWALIEELAKAEQLGHEGGKAVAVQPKPGDPESKPQTILDVLNRISQAMDRIRTKRFDIGDSKDKMDQLQEQLKQLREKLAQLPPKFKELADGTAGLGEKIGKNMGPALKAATDLDTAVKAAIEDIKKLIDLSKSIPDAPKRPGRSPDEDVTEPETDARGGLVGRFASGGFLADFYGGRFARGTDRIPAMLSRGEYVVNAGATRQFLPLLRVLNAGRLPAAAGRDGASATTNVGDIHVNVQGGDTAEATVRNIAHGLRRALRTGTVRIY